jgi:hypothetical protein
MTATRRCITSGSRPLRVQTREIVPHVLHASDRHVLDGRDAALEPSTTRAGRAIPRLHLDHRSSDITFREPIR